MMKVIWTSLVMLFAVATWASDFRITFDTTPPRGLPPETLPRPPATNAPARLLDIGPIKEIQVRYFNTNMFTSESVSNYLANLVERNPEIKDGIFWADPQVTSPTVEAYVTFNGTWHGGPSRWLIWPQRAIIWAPWPSHCWMFLAWMDDAKLREDRKQ